MLKKSVTYTDLNGQEITEVLCFHLSKAELIEWEVSETGGLSAHLQQIIDSNDGKQIIAMFKKLIVDSYGVRSDDGKRFIKDQELSEEFVTTEAYSALFIELATNAAAAADFVNGIMPEGLEEDVRKIAAQAPVEEPRVEVEKAEKQLTRAAATELSDEELKAKIAEGWVIIS
jgi:hypothetical protein